MDQRNAFSRYLDEAFERDDDIRQHELALALGVGQSTVSDYRRGIKIPRPHPHRLGLAAGLCHFPSEALKDIVQQYEFSDEQKKAMESAYYRKLAGVDFIRRFFDEVEEAITQIKRLRNAGLFEDAYARSTDYVQRLHDLMHAHHLPKTERKIKKFLINVLIENIECTMTILPRPAIAAAVFSRCSEASALAEEIGDSARKYLAIAWLGDAYHMSMYHAESFVTASQVIAESSSSLPLFIAHTDRILSYPKLPEARNYTDIEADAIKALQQKGKKGITNASDRIVVWIAMAGARHDLGIGRGGNLLAEAKQETADLTERKILRPIQIWLAELRFLADDARPDKDRASELLRSLAMLMPDSGISDYVQRANGFAKRIGIPERLEIKRVVG